MQVTIRQDDGHIITISGDLAVHVADGVLHVAVTGHTKRVRHGRQWTDDPQPPVTRCFPLVRVMEYQLEEMPAANL